MKRLEDNADATAARDRQLIFAHRTKVGPSDAHIAAGRAFEPAKDRHQRRFARSRRAEKRNTAAARHQQIDPLQYRSRAFALTQRQRDIARIDYHIAIGFIHRRGLSRAMTGKHERYVAGVAVLQVLLIAGCNQSAPVPPQAKVVNSPDAVARAARPKGDERLILAFGDSLYSGYRLGRGESLPDQVQDRLRAAGINATVVNAGVSGDTTAAARQRLVFALDNLPRTPDLVILGFGGNDVLRQLAPAETRANLVAMLDLLKVRDIPVLLTGMRAPPNLGPDYVSRFDAIYPELAAKYDAELDPFVLDGVIGNSALMLPDRVHPNARGVAIMADRVARLAERRFNAARQNVGRKS